MSNSIPIGSDLTAPTPQNTPLNQAPIAAGLSRPTVPDIKEDQEPGEGDGDSDGESEGGAELDEAQAAVLGLVQGRLADLVGKSSGYIDSLPDEIKRKIEGLKGLQTKTNELQNKYKRECLALEKKYLELQKPIFDRRNAIVNGQAAPTAEEIEAGEKQSVKDDEDYAPLPKPSGEEDTSSIPEFWLTALHNHPMLSEIITERDSEALKHLVDLSLSYLPDADTKPGFKLIFTFAPNDYFTNTTLEKTYLYQEEVGYAGDFVYDRAIGTEINWKEDKDLTKEFEIKKQRNKNTNRTRLVRKARPTESFFNFFSPPVPPSDDAIEQGDLEDEELEEIEEKLEIDYQLGEDLKEKIIPHAVDWFTGKALKYEVLDDEEYSDDEDYEDMDSDEDDDDDEDAPPRRKGNKARGAAGAPGAEDCKQQ